MIRFFKLLRSSTEPIYARIEHMLVEGNMDIISGEFSVKMHSTMKVVDTLFFISLTIHQGMSTRYRSLEDSCAVSRSLQ